MTEIQRKAVILIALNGFIMTAVGLGALGAYFFGQDLEHALFGYVVHIPKGDDTWRGYITNRGTGREVEVGCFRLHGLRKLGEAVDPQYFFKAKATISDPINVSAYVANTQHQETGEGLKSHDVGQTWDRPFCFEMPSTIGDDQWLTMSGRAEHIRLAFGVPWPFWRTVTPVPEFKIKPEFCYESLAAMDSKACTEEPRSWAPAR